MVRDGILYITVPATEDWDEANQCFINTKETTLILKHSLVSLSKWEANWRISFLDKFGKKNTTVEQILDYVRCMTTNQNVDPNVYRNLTQNNIEEVFEYIGSSMTATTFSDHQKPVRKRIVTSELLYSWMIDFNIPFQCEKWPLDRLITLMRVCEAEHRKQEKGSTRRAMQRNAEIKRRNRAKKAARK